MCGILTRQVCFIFMNPIIPVCIISLPSIMVLRLKLSNLINSLLGNLARRQSHLSTACGATGTRNKDKDVFLYWNNACYCPDDRRDPLFTCCSLCLKTPGCSLSLCFAFHYKRHILYLSCVVLYEKVDWSSLATRRKLQSIFFIDKGLLQNLELSYTKL